MTAQLVLIWFSIFAPVVLTVGMLYGDWQEGDFVPFWQRRKSQVNSGAKFG